MEPSEIRKEVQTEVQAQLQRSWLTRKVWGRDILSWVMAVLLLVLTAEVALLTRALFVSSVIISASMEPTLNKGDRVLVRRIRYTPQNLPKRGEIVLLRDPTSKSNWLTKRVIGLPNEELLIWMGRVYINGVPLQESYLKGAFLDYHRRRIPSDGVFVMGDNRRFSDDSRDFGSVPLELIEGRVVLRYYPFSRFGRVQ